MRLPGNAVPANLRPAETTTSMVKCSPNAELDVGPTQTDPLRPLDPLPVERLLLAA
jgi:hypothetical protein